MNDYKLCDISVGLEESFSVDVTEQMQQKFLEMTGDCNPMHVSDCFALDAGFEGGRLVYGMLTASFVSTLAGVYLPGKHCLLQECDVQFIRPVYVGDNITIKGVVKEVDERFSRIRVQVFMFNQDGERVLRGTYYAGLKSGGQIE